MPAPKRLLFDADIVIRLLKKRSDVLCCFLSSGSHRYTQVPRSPSFQQGLPEPKTAKRIHNTWMYLSLPSMALDTRFPAGMTTPAQFGYNDESLRLGTRKAKRLLRETGSWSFLNRIPKLELGN
jgi:hypothetical protein